MKIFFVLALCFCILQINSQAQSSQSPDKQPTTQSQNSPKELKKSKNKSLSKDLGLSKEQSLKINTYKKDGKKRKAEIMNNKDLSLQQKDAALKSLKKENKTKISNVLTTEQKAKLKEMKKKSSPKDSTSPGPGKEATK